MTITARYAGRCTTCGQAITPGQQIEWARGASRHTTCPTTTTAPPAQRRRPATRRVSSARPAARRRALEAGERQIYRDSREYEVGDVVRIHGQETWLTVVACGSYRISEGEDDTRVGERRYWAHARPATADEAAAAQARQEAREAREARAREVAQQLRASRIIGEIDPRLARLPADAVKVWGDSRLAGSETWYETPDGVIWYCASAYDDGPAVWQTTATRALLDEAQALALRAGI